MKRQVILYIDLDERVDTNPITGTITVGVNDNGDVCDDTEESGNVYVLIDGIPTNDHGFMKLEGYDIDNYFWYDDQRICDMKQIREKAHIAKDGDYLSVYITNNKMVGENQDQVLLLNEPIMVKNKKMIDGWFCFEYID